MARRKPTAEAEAIGESPRVERNARRDAIAKVAGEFSFFRPAHQVLSVVRAVPTIFAQFDHASGVYGLPLDRFGLIHGKSGEGKTLEALGLLKSFLKRDHFAALIDAERTTPITWCRSLMGEYADHPGFFAVRPDTYEGTIQGVRAFLTTIIRLREEEKIHADTSALIICDSIRKLVPEKQLQQIMAAKDGDISRRSAQIKAAMNAAWMDEIVPMLEKAGAAFFAIAREMQDPDADPFKKKFGLDYKVGGGGALYYDASMVIRVERAAYVTEKKVEGQKSKIFGERHRVRIRKTKVSGHEDRDTVCYFHSSNGVLIPAGFDPARDIVELGARFGIIKKSGAWLSWGKHRWNGEHSAVKKLAADESLLASLETEVRAKFATEAPEEIEEGE
jgi:recombination protein RecA